MIDYSIGVCFVGSSFVGKSSLGTRLDKNEFFYDMLTTIGVDYLTTIFNINYKEINYSLKWRIWDTAGQETFKSLITSYFKSGTVYILMYDITDKQSFKELDYWTNEILDNGTNSKFIYLVGNKTDKIFDRIISKEQGELYANYINAKYFEISVKNNTGIKDLVDTINYDIMEYIVDNKDSKEEKENIGIKYELEKYNLFYEEKKDKKCCIIM